MSNRLPDRPRPAHSPKSCPATWFRVPPAASASNRPIPKTGWRRTRNPTASATRPAPRRPPSRLLRHRPRRASPSPKPAAAAHRQGLHLGKPALGPWADAHGHRQRPCGRSLPDRHAVPLHGEHGVELLHGHGPRDRDADRHRPGKPATYVIPRIIYSRCLQAARWSGPIPT